MRRSIERARARAVWTKVEGISSMHDQVGKELGTGLGILFLAVQVLEVEEMSVGDGSFDVRGILKRNDEVQMGTCESYGAGVVRGIGRDVNREREI